MLNILTVSRQLDAVVEKRQKPEIRCCENLVAEPLLFFFVIRIDTRVLTTELMQCVFNNL